MIIAVERGMDEIKNQLETRGYKTVYTDEGELVDVIIYNSGSFPAYKISKARAMTMSNNKGYNEYGVLLINGENKNIDHIIEIINTRSYGRLF